MVSTPGGFSGSSDYYHPDQLRNAYEARNPGKSFENFLNEGETKYGKGSMDPIRKNLTKANTKSAPKKPTDKNLASKRTAKKAPPKKK